MLTAALSVLGATVPLAVAQPYILQQPVAQSIWAGDSAMFTVNVYPRPALVYQWRFNGAPLAGAQDSFLILQDVQPAQAGTYDVVATDASGSSTSSPAPLSVSSQLNDPGLPRIGIAQAANQLQLNYWPQNTQGVYFVLQSDFVTNLWKGTTLTNGAVPPGRQESRITLPPALGPKFYEIIEDPTASLSDFTIPASAGQPPASLLNFVVQQGVPQPLAAGTAFTCTFILSGSNGAPLSVSGPATLVLVDGSGQPATFSYTIQPAQLQFSAGIAMAFLTINTSSSLTGCSLALQAAAPSPLAGPAPVIPWTLPGALSFNPGSPTYASNVAQAFGTYRQQYGIATPNWGYPFSGAQRAVVGNFGQWFLAGYQINSGIDFADVPGTGVLAAEQGVVTSVVDAGPDSYLVIDHGFGQWTLYQNVYVHPPQCSVKLFDPVVKGQLITELLGDHLHFGIRAARNTSENQLTVNAMPGNALNPQMDPVFQTYLFPTNKQPPLVQKITLTPRNPSTERFNGVSMTAAPQSSPGSVYVLVQAVDLLGSAKLAPANVTFAPSVSFGLIAPIQISFTNLDQAQLYNPMSSQNLTDRGIALYSTELVSNAFSSAEKFRYWFKWDTTPYAGIRIGPRQVYVQVDDGTTNVSPNLAYDFGPEILGKQVVNLGKGQYQFTVAAHLGCLTYFGQSIQPDQYTLEVFDRNGQPIPGVQWQNTQPGNQSRLFTRYLDQESYTLTLPAGTDLTSFRVRATSTLLPDIADEISPSFAPPNIVPLTNMVWIPSGTFVIGSPANEPVRDPNEGMQMLVTLTNGFWMKQFEISQIEYLNNTGTNPSYMNGDRSGPPWNDVNYGVDLTRPVEWVNWDEATNYCYNLTLREQRAGHIPTNYVYRLPTEAEWEYACRAGTTTAFSYGPALRTGMANFFDLWEYDQEVGSIVQIYGQFRNCSTPVGSYKPNTWGLYDMHGNVWEWVIDTLNPYPGGSVTNPVVSNGPERIIRGGSYETFGYNTRTARRNHHDESYHYGFIGIRMVLAPGTSQTGN